MVTKDDVASRRHFADTVCRGRDYYTPYRAMLPREIDQILVAGRHYSATPQAQKSSREIPPCMAMGEAAALPPSWRLMPEPRSARPISLKFKRGCARKGQTPATRHPPMHHSWRLPNDPPSLDGVRVIDFTQVMLGPCCTQTLADYGAEVIKIEKSRIGDLSRWSLGSDPDGLNNPVFCSLNRNKKSLALDLKQKAVLDGILDLIKGADVVVNNFRPGVMERMGLGYETLKALNPKLIYAVGTGFGLEGPYQHKGGQTSWPRR